MAETRKRNWNKIFILSFIILAVILIVGGLILILNLPHTGSEQILDSNVQMVSAIHEFKEELSDDEFQFGMHNIVPMDNTDPDVITDALNTITNEYAQQFDIVCDAEYLNYFGHPAACITLPDTVDLVTSLTPIQNNTLFTKVYILLADKDTKVVHTEYIYEDEDLVRAYYPHELETSDVPAILQTLLADLSAEYSLTSENFKYSSDELEIDVSSLDDNNSICVFDYCWQYILSCCPGMTLVLRSGDILVASAIVTETENYTRYYPYNDLAPLFRLTYYYQCDFLKNSLRTTAQQLYL